ncbi:MAG TPA: cyclopropane-fatty-acyl-phospholipid synthase family protein [Steroidobacteraceae bacterium]|nr:cyclopropane-fatty-acyl-phospholipid synthase family protein [Steroidobacteraceae bacterium]
MNAIEQGLAKGRERQAENASENAVISSAPSQPQLPAQALDEGKRTDRWVLTRLLASLGSPPIELAVRDGAHVAAGTPIARVTFDSRATLLWVLRDVPLRFGDAYSDGTVTIEGDLVALLEAVNQAGRRAGGERGRLTQRFSRALRRRNVNTLSGSRDNIHHHYDIGNAFYELWLGSTMAYTCAYYPHPAATLDEAQVAKMDHVCRKLRLRAGESVVEAGCGWGMLAMHMARRYGVRVRAFNISHEQIIWARERAQREGLSGQVEYVEDDYRNISGGCDAFVSVGMLEHVGVKNYTTLGGVVQRCLGGRGRGLIHSIGRNGPALLHPWTEKRIFPGAHPPALSEMARIFEPWDLSILDVENLRLHYAQTLRHWLALYEGASERVRSMFDEKFVRMWRLYLCGSIASFTTGSLQLFQVVFAPGASNDVPWTRAHLYTN